jgi:diguanylate cyclase (GGDEF)-like protein
MKNALQAENKLLTLQLQSLLEEARLNEKKWRRLDQLERQLIATRTLPELIQVILQNYKNTFDTDIVTLVLSDPEYAITRILESEKQGGSKVPGLVLLEKIYSDNTALYLGAFDTDLPCAIFDPWPSEGQSMILIPLLNQGKLIGSLNLASVNADRFTPDSGTDFMQRLAVIFSICLENALNHERLKQVGFTDPLTMVYNRRYLETRCQEEVITARRHKRSLACMFLDIDKFKRINDSYGHLAGDEVLRSVAKLIKSQLRSNDVLARYGGEEFVVLLPQTTLQSACEIAERIRCTIAAQPLPATPTAQLTVTISIGVATLHETAGEEDVLAAHKLFSSADEALYQAKESGRNKVVSEGNYPVTVVAKHGLMKFLKTNLQTG